VYYVRNSEQGGALLIVLAIMVMLTIAAILAVNTAQTDIDLSFNQLHSDQAFYVAEAGLMKAFAELNNDNDWNIGYSNEYFESGIYSVAVVDSFVEPELIDTVILKAAGNINDANVNLEAIVVPEYYRPFEYAVYADISLNMDNNVYTDSYNSELGEYATTADSVDGDVASNGTMVFTNTAIVGGDASTADADGISLCATCTVMGDTATNIDPYIFPVIPDSLYDLALLNTPAPATISGSYSYDDIAYTLDMVINDSAVISAGTYYFSSINIGNGSQMRLPAGDTVIIYLDGDLIVGQNTEINADGNPGNLIIFSRGGSMILGQSTIMQAAFYGLTVDVSLANNCEFFGSIVSNSTTAVNAACFHYDRSLRLWTMGKTGAMLMIAWKQT
jgi:hypothetical protein